MSRKIDASGYARVKVDGVWRFEHRVVAEQVLGRPLDGSERVYHRSDDLADNRPENLVVGPAGIGRAVQVLDSLVSLADLCDGNRAACCCALREAKRRRDREYQARKRAKAAA